MTESLPDARAEAASKKGKRSRRKGVSFENTVKNVFVKAGIPAQRTLDQVRFGTSEVADVTAFPPGQDEIKIECKHWKTFTGRLLWEWIKGHTIAVVKITHLEPPLVVMRLEDYIKLINNQAS